MTHVSVSDFRQNLASHLDHVTDSRAPLVVTRASGKSVVVLSEDEYEAMAETLHLLSSLANASRLREAIDELESGRGREYPLARQEP